MGEGGFEPPKASPADLQSVPFGHSGIPPYYITKADDRTRTDNLLITNQLLCQLSHIGIYQQSYHHAVMDGGGFEPPKAVPADLQSVPFGHSGIPPYSLRSWWSWWTDSNPRPADYKSAALPTELHQHLQGQQPSSSRPVIIAETPSFVNSFFLHFFSPSISAASTFSGRMP